MMHESKINGDANGKFASNHEPDLCMADYIYLCMEALDTEELLDAMGRLRAFMATSEWPDMAKRIKGAEEIVRSTSPKNDKIVHDMVCCWLLQMQRKLLQDLVDGDYTGD